MRIKRSPSTSRRWIAGLVLAAIALRSLIPAGFMPVPGRLLSLEICPDGLSAAAFAALTGSSESMAMSMPMPDSDAATAHGESAQIPGGEHHHPASGTAHLEHCLFGAGSAAAPLPHGCVLAFERAAGLAVPVAFTPQRPIGFSAYLPAPRGPPLSL